MLNDGKAWLEAQQAVIGSALIDSRCVPEILSSTTEEDFYGACKTVYRAICQVFSSGRPADPITVRAVLGEEYTDFMMQLMEITPTAANVKTYIELCKEHSQLVRLRELGRLLQESADLAEAAALAERVNMMAAARTGLKAVTMEASMELFFERRSKRPDYLNWPLAPLNEHLFAEAGDFVVVGGYPSSGKSAFAIQTAYHMSRNKRVGFFSLETSPAKLHDRLVSHVARISMRRIKTNYFLDTDWERAASSSSQIISRNLEYISAAGATVSEIRAFSIAHQYDVIIVDYLQLVEAPGRDRVSVVAGISRGLHTMAQSTGISVIALAQLSRPDEYTGTGKNSQFKIPNGPVYIAPPTMHDLKESSQIEQDADVVLMLYQPRSDIGDRMLLIRKNKEGELRSLALGFDGLHQTFYVQQDPPDVPDIPYEEVPEGSLKDQADRMRLGLPPKRPKGNSKRPRPDPAEEVPQDENQMTME